ncbi:uncharacterized protein [Primulina huaijiensis]|uniref:uncharacterized protein n=1 Tax=Primulina huaijiensis TaxID=1492673 RepID=UPI003CC793AD
MEEAQKQKREAVRKERGDRMDLQGYHLEAVETALFGFAGHVVYPEGEIVLPLTLGSQNLKKTMMTTFTVVDSPSSYNIILGRPAMNELKAVASTYHQKIKFPVGSKVGEVRGDQPSSRKCYVEAVRVDQSKAKKEEKKARTNEVGGRTVEKGEVQFVAEEEQENAGAPYQRLMNKVFEKQLRRNMEVYVDDILGKTREVASFIDDLEETFATLVHYGIKLNPANHALRGPELRYIEVEKIALALIMTVRKLRPYFLSHRIIVLTNSPLGRIMTHSEVSGRMIKWAVELGEYDIEYKPPVAIKTQALSDFLSEMVQPDEDEVWRGFVDGASILAGCGVGVVVISPPGEKIKLALRLDSRVTNNEAEYEAVLAGIRAAQEIGASRVILYSDSQLITQQIKGAYEAKDDSMLQYLQLIKTQGPLLKCVSEGEVDYVLREIHVGCCAEHLGGMALARKTMLAGFWWPTLSQNSARVVQACEKCQHHSNFQHSPATPMKPIWASCPFDQWGMDIVGPFPTARAQKNPSCGNWANFFPGKSYPDSNDQSRAMELDLVKEKRDRAIIRMEAYRGRVMKAYNKKVRVRDFQIGDLVMKKVNPTGDVRKLEARWEGPYKIIRKVSSGSFSLEDAQGRSFKRPWNVISGLVHINLVAEK